jgi:hypothetical protein
LAFLVEDVFDVVGAECLVVERGAEGAQEFVAAKVVVEDEESSEVVVEVELSVDEPIEVGFGRRADGEEVGDELFAAGPLSATDEGFGMFGIFDVEVFVERAWVATRSVLSKMRTSPAVALRVSSLPA